MAGNNGNGRLTMNLIELSKLIGCSRATIYDQASKNALPVKIIRVGKKIYVARRDVIDLLGSDAVKVDER